MKIYTKVGDEGNTSLIGGQKVSKSDLRLDTYGTVDELNSTVGLAVAFLNEKSNLKPELQSIQNQLFNLGSLLACASSDQLKNLPQITQQNVETLEKSIDSMTAHLPALKNFILPGGAPAAAALHQSRTVCRRAERLLVEFTQTLSSLPAEYGLCIVYLNRLSDYFFTAARFCNHVEKIPDQEWVK